MSGKNPHLTPEAEAARAARLAREAAALRENLRRRKTQARAKATPGDGETEAEPAAPQQTLES